MTAAVSLSTVTALSAAVRLGCADVVAGVWSGFAGRGGASSRSGGLWKIEKEKGAPEAGFGMGAAIVARSRRQASCKMASVSAAGRALTEPQ